MQEGLRGEKPGQPGPVVALRADMMLCSILLTFLKPVFLTLGWKTGFLTAWNF